MSFIDDQMELENNLKDKTCNGECSKCGDCCGLFIPFTKKELEKIKKYVKLHNIQPENRYDPITGALRGHCCFLSEKDWKCMIYPVRPYVCRDFICNRKDWKKYRDKYSTMGDYNGYNRFTHKSNTLASFDDLIYDNYDPVIRYIANIAYVDGEGVDKDRFLLALKMFHREDLLNLITVTDENGKKTKGKDLEQLN